ncbi:MAG: phospholipase A [Tannerella sp.]|jgi:phospholipase A1|nr:phospholipase A [Tannerella sp.]
MRHFRTALLVVLAWLAYRAPAQEKEIAEMWRDQLDTAAMNYYRPEYLIIDEAEMLSLFDRQPSFGMYKDNYFITGIPLSGKIDKHTADVKFQISVRQRLTRTVLPFNTSLSLTYTQKSFWNLYMKSAPFEDNNYNPGFALVKPLIYKNQLRGSAVLALEHESNGKDSLDSRGWNYVTLTGVYFFNASFTLQAKVWAGIMDRGETAADGDGGNPDLYKYRGYGLVAMNYRSLNDRFWASAVINPRNRFRSANIQLELNFKMNSNVNQYLFVQWYNGYGESLLEYNRYASMIRVGICIKPALRNLY